MRPSSTTTGNSKASANARNLPAGTLAPGLYLTATPLGNARDITLRALDVLAGADLIVAEDTRVTAKLLAIHAIRRPTRSYNDHNAKEERPRLLARLSAGERIALVSDAGTPLISDPGFKLVREAIADGISVHAIPGASAVLTALLVSGLPSDRFLFAGFLPARAGERRRMLTELQPAHATLIFFESARRLSEALKDMHEVFGARQVAVARELTKLHEEVRRGSLDAVAAHFPTAPKGEITIVVAGAAAEDAPLSGLSDSLLQRALALMPLSSAVDLLAEATGQPRTALYQQALKLRADESR
ncbi:MAG: 16S rRNA (cytidine(1402)-2'-O)-methyltransferase [Alphaproteobacteria bacterium]|nr:16S rRNA (cytidine(1402)-2'-O)-methyltransferase [Alphaproteobacteria bacterium]